MTTQKKTPCDYKVWQKSTKRMVQTHKTHTSFVLVREKPPTFAAIQSVLTRGATLFFAVAENIPIAHSR